ncbi:MAG: 2-oxoacid:acceptor oxidoreductase family protein [Acidobacteria bacterium]|nr:2-oxoacid:acceptor oxidoreductase family protein [Acidobacteriota bacterium]MBI3654916.1 2-oxoacid:acceptor oxidoreductase family protein [Acidobacteriota bacterium]
MIEIRIHGRGGQGAVVASSLLAKAYAYEGFHVQAFPEFGVERRGAPVLSFIRVDEKPIRLRTKVYQPNHIIVLDSALLKFIDVTAGLDPNGIIILNSPLKPGEVKLNGSWIVATVNASEIAAECGIGTATSPIANTAILGAYARAVPLLPLMSVTKAIEETFGGKSRNNLMAVEKAFENTALPSNFVAEALEAYYQIR